MIYVKSSVFVTIFRIIIFTSNNLFNVFFFFFFFLFVVVFFFLFPCSLVSYFLQTRLSLWSPTAAAMIGRTALSRGITAHRLNKNVTLYLNELTSPVSGHQTKASEDQKPLLLMLPWLGSRPQAIHKYCEIYFRTGFDVLVVESEVRRT